MFRSALRAFATALVVAAAGAHVPAQAAYDFGLPAWFPAPPVPADNPMTSEKVELGRHLFYDTRMSGNGTQSCATCHEQERAFTDGKARSVGSTGQTHPRGSMSLVNIAYAAVLTWGNPAMTRLEEQALVPMYGDAPIELGLTRDDRWVETIRRDATYRRLFAAAFPGETDAFTRSNVTKALATFQRSIVSARSPYDRYHFERDDTAISASARRGEVLFHSRALACFTCHGGAHFSDSMSSRRMRVGFHNTGLYNLSGALSYPSGGLGAFETTREPRDVGRFKAPTLRNVAVTAPYMHDGSVATLDEAISHYAAGGRTIADGDYRGVGRDNPNKDEAIGGFMLTPAQRADLVEFLRTLTDEALLRDPRWSNPWPASGPTGSQEK